jgi:hypothetical protein
VEARRRDLSHAPYKDARIRVAYEAGPAGCSLYDALTLNTFFREYDKRTRILRNFARKFIDPVFRPQFKKAPTVLATAEGRRRLRSLHLVHFDLLEQAASLIAAGAFSQRLEHF